MTFYKSIPVTVEARRFDGSGSCGMDILKWLADYGLTNAIMFGYEFDRPAQLDLLIPHVKIAEYGDYIVRMLGVDEVRKRFKVMTEDHFKATYESACPTCSGRVRETTNLVCQTCGHDYSKGF